MDRFDHLYMTVGKEAGGIEGLLDSFFSFLYRRTDFFYEADPNDKMGFPPGVNQQIIFSVFKRYQDEYYKKVPKKTVEEYKAKLEALKAKQAEAKPEISKNLVNQVPEKVLDIQKPVEANPMPKEVDAPQPLKDSNDKIVQPETLDQIQTVEKAKDDNFGDIR